MKPVFKCDYCSQMGTEEEIREHELQCTENYDRKSCYTCIHKRTKTKDYKWYYECEAGMEIPVGKIFEFCPSYERNEESITITNLFGDIFKF